MSQLVRIVSAPKSNDGWIAKTLPDSSHRGGKVCFISNLDSIIQEIATGQVWESMTILETRQYNMIQLTSRPAKAASN